LFLLLFSVPLWAEEMEMSPFSMKWPPADNPDIDLSFLLKKPAGRDGFITVRDGHFSTPSGKRFRAWGINVTAGATVPSKAEAPFYARFLAQRGINCLRFHFLDLPAPRGIIDPTRKDTRGFDPEYLDRFDFFVAELKKQGIYTNLNLNVARTYKEKDGVKDWEFIGYAKGLTYFDDRLIELQKEYASMLLTHLNPYTQSEYRNEPAVAIVELVNENSIVESWFSGRLLGRNVTRNPGTWTDITRSYEIALTEKFNQWLNQNLEPSIISAIREESVGSSEELIPRLKPEEFQSASRERFHAEASFYISLERDFFWMMRDFLKQEIGLQSLIAGTSDHNHWRTGYPLLYSTSQLDVVDGHTYWQHPSYIRDPDSGRNIGFKIPNTPMVDDPFHSSVVELSRSAISGRPYTVSEVNHPFPNQFAAEGIPILAAYGLFQDWDGIFWYTLEHDSPVRWQDRIEGHFDFASDPVKMTQLVPGALAFLRGDIQSSLGVVARGYSRDEVIESIRDLQQERPYFSRGFPLSLPLQHGIRIISFQQRLSKYPELSALSPLVSDTQQLRWYFEGKGKGAVKVESDRSQGLIGHLAEINAALENLEADIENPFCAVTLTALDELPISHASKMILVAVAGVSNWAMKWNEEKTTLEEWGTGPTMIETVKGTVKARNLKDAKKVFYQALDSQGVALGSPVDAVGDTQGWSIQLGKVPTTWYLITVER
jgi:hypothetical protein